MGLSSKQVSSDGLDWSQTLLQAQTLELPKPPAARRQEQQNQPQAELLKCPRCDSTNTKFCYYNNYNKSQPRHFCKACKRHWTKGGTLRNVPVGGGRKNKRHKTSSKTSSAKASTSSRSTSTNSGKTRDKGGLQAAGQADHKQQKEQNLPLVLDDHKGMSNILKQSTQISPPSSTFQQKAISYSNFGVRTSNGVFPQNQDLPFSYSRSSSSFEACSSSMPTSFQSLNVYNFPGEAVEDSTITTTVPSSNCSNTMAQPWQVPSTSNAMDTASYWNWDDIETLVSGDFNIPWDDPEIKP